MKLVCSCLSLVASLVLAAACSRTNPSEGVRVDASDDLSKVTIEARGVPLSTILTELRNKQRIDVRLNQPVDPTVTVSIRDQPLEDALTQIVPSGTHYVVRTGTREWAGGGLKSGPKTGAAVPPVKDAPVKGVQRPPVPSPAGAAAKRAADSIPSRPLPTGPTYKRAAAEIAQVPRGEGPKRTGAGGPTQPPKPNQTLRLRFTLTDTGAVRLDSAVLIEGTPPAEKRVVGPYLYAIRRQDGAMADFGTFGDPLVEHSFRPEDQRHDERRAREGSFAISIPGATREQAQSLSIQIYDARNVPLPSVLDQRTFDETSRQARALRQVSGQEIVRAMQEKRQ
jgi:hypothetical protein